MSLENSKDNSFNKHLLNAFYVLKNSTTTIPPHVVVQVVPCTIWPKGPLEPESRIPGFLKVPYEPAVGSVTGITGAPRKGT